jgi:hypothetical protein
VPIPFTTYPWRPVPVAPASPRWTVAIHRAGAWQGWRWLDRLESLALHPGWDSTEFGFVPLLLWLPAVPAIVARRVAYAARRRTDWEVLVFRGHADSYRPKAAVLVETLPSKAAAVERAEQMWRHLSDYDRLPDRDGLPGHLP